MVILSEVTELDSLFRLGERETVMIILHRLEIESEKVSKLTKKKKWAQIVLELACSSLLDTCKNEWEPQDPQLQQGLSGVIKESS